jgi:hypothetical protein
MDFERYTGARVRLNEFIQALNIAEAATQSAQAQAAFDDDGEAMWQLQAGGDDKYGHGGLAALTEMDHDEILRQRIRQMIREGAITATLQHEPLSLTEQLEREHRYLARTIFNAVGEPQQPRFPGEEGLYVPPRADMPDWDLFRMESRLAREDPRREFFFDENGHMVVAPELLGDPDTRVFELRDPFLPPDPRLATVVHAPRQGPQARQWLSFVVNVARLRVEDHPLFTLEDYLCVALRREVERWHRRRALAVTHHYTSQIRALQARAGGQLQRLQAILARLSSVAAGAAAAASAAGAEQLSALRGLCSAAVYDVLSGLTQLREARVARDEEWAAEQRHFAAIYAAWQRIKAFREHMGSLYASMGYLLAGAGIAPGAPTPGGPAPTSGAPDGNSDAASPRRSEGLVYVGHPLALKVRRTAPDHGAELEAWRADELAELDEARKHRELMNLLEDLEEEPGAPGPGQGLEDLLYRDGGAALQAQLAGLPEAERAAQLADWETQVRDERLRKREKARRRAFDATTEFARIRSRMLASRKPPGRPLLEPLLDATLPVTPETACPPAEVKRRQKLASSLLSVSLYVNGHWVADGDRAPIAFPAWTVDVNFAARLQLTAAPHSVTFAVRLDGFFAAQTLAEFFLPVPDIRAQPHLREVACSGRRFDGRLPAADVSADRFHQFTAVCSAFWNVPAGVLKDPDVLRAFASHADVSLPPQQRRGANANALQLPGGGGGMPAKDAARLDPNDPRTALLAGLSRRSAAGLGEPAAAGAGAAFEGWEVRPDLLLVNEDYHVESARKRLLRARRNALFLREPVPLREDEFTPEMLALLAQLDAAAGAYGGDPAAGSGAPGFSAVVAMGKRVQDLTGDGDAPAPAAGAGTGNAALMPSAAALAALRESLATDAAGGPVDMAALEHPMRARDNRAGVGAAAAAARADMPYYGVSLRDARGGGARRGGDGGGGPSIGARVGALSAVGGLTDGQPGDLDVRLMLGLVGTQNDLAVTDVSDVVYEQVAPDLVMTSTFMRDLLRPVRPLFVYRDDVRAVTNPRGCALVCQVLRASNVPLRLAAGGTLMPGQSAEQRDGARAQALNCVVQVAFQESVRRTSAAAGPHPRWQEVLYLPFTTPNESYDAASLLQLQTPILVSVYDQVTVANDVLDARTQRTQLASVDLRYLGSVEIPFSTVYSTSTIDGAFEVCLCPALARIFQIITSHPSRLLLFFICPSPTHLQVEVPLLHLGYQTPNPATPTVIHLYLTLDPLLVPPRNDPYAALLAVPAAHRSVDSSSTETGVVDTLPRASAGGLNPAFRRVIDWSRAVSVGDRAVTPLVGDINSEPQLITRFLTAQAPPPACQGHPRLFTRFVSLVPFVEDYRLPLGDAPATTLRDVWCTSAQFLRLSSGDWEEHAVLLCNYFYWWEAQTAEVDRQNGVVWETYLVVGTAVPEGDTCYVLRIKKVVRLTCSCLYFSTHLCGTLIDSRLLCVLFCVFPLCLQNGFFKEQTLYNAVTHRAYATSYDSALLPLKEVLMLVTRDNVYANLQERSAPIDLDFNVRNPASWAPLFTAKFDIFAYNRLYGAAYTTLQKDLRDAYEPDPRATLASAAAQWGEFSRRLERVLERNFESWRALPTRWNYGAARLARELLVQLEGGDPDDLRDRTPVSKLRAAFSSVHGFPLHFPCAADDDVR